MAGERVIFDIDNTDFDTTIELFDPSGNSVAFNDDDANDPGSLDYNSFLDFTASESGIYYLAVGSYNGILEAGSSYTLHVSTDVDFAPENGAPNAASDMFSGMEDQALILTIDQLLANDSDPDGDEIAFTGVSGSNVELLGDGTIRFTPVADAHGTFDFTYTISDGNGADGIGSVSVILAAMADAPQPAGDVYSGVEDQVRTIPIASLLANDADPDGDTLQLHSLTPLTGGTVELDGAGNVVFTPDANFNGIATFSYETIDGTGRTGSAEVHLDLAAVNDAPRVVTPMQNYITLEDTALQFDIPAETFADTENDAISVSATLADDSPLPAWLSFNAETRSFAGTPPADFNGALNLIVIATDGRSSVQAAFSLTIDAVNDRPVAATDSGFTVMSGDAVVIAATTLLANDSDVDALQTLSITSVGSATGGMVSLSGGNVTFTAQAGYTGSGSFTYTVADELGGTDIATVHLTVQPAIIVGTAGNDTLNGTAGNDTLEGLAGDDTLSGGAGSDIYLYAAGDGHDTISDGAWTNDVNKVIFDASVHSTDVVVERTVGAFWSATLLLGSSGSVTITNQYGDWSDGIEEFRFADGIVWTRDDLEREYIRQHSTSGDDDIHGFYSSSVIATEAGDDILRGFIGDDQLDGGADDDLIWGGAGNDIIVGGTENDWLTGDSGADKFSFKALDGDDTITDFAVATDKIELNGFAGIVSFADVLSVATQSGNHTLFNLGAGASIELLNVAMSTFTVNDFIIVPDVTSGTESADVMTGTSISEVFRSLGGDNSISAGNGNDILEGGLGNDTLTGGSGSDSYNYALGDGADAISEGAGASYVDKLFFGEGITTADVQIERNVSNFWGGTLTLSGGGTIAIENQFNGGSSGIEEFHFADGTVWTKAELEQQYISQHSTANADNIHGFYFNDVMHTGAGDDTLRGFEGNDTLYGDVGNDLIWGGTGDDVIVGGADDDWITGDNGADTFRFAKFDGDYTVTDFEVGLDSVELVGLTGIEDLADVLAHASQVGNDVDFNFGAEGGILLKNVALASLTTDNFLFAA